MTADALFHRLRYTPMRDVVRGRITARLDIEGIINNAELPEEAAACVRKVVKRTRLKRLEKADVAEELAAHFRDGLDDGEDADDLIESFGDPRKAARLIRRAKIRQRHWLWHAMRWCRLTLLVTIFAYLMLTAYLMLGKPEPSIDYLAQLNAALPQVPEDEKAWPLYREGLLQMGWYSGNKDFIDMRTTFNEGVRPGDERWNDFATFIDENSDAIDVLRRAAMRDAIGYEIIRGYHDEDIDLWLGPEGGVGYKTWQRQIQGEPLISSAIEPHLSTFHWMSVCLQVDAIEAAHAGDHDRAVADLRALLSMSKQVRLERSRRAIIISGFVQSRGVEALNWILEVRPSTFTNDDIRDLAHQISSVGNTPLSVEVDRLTFIDLLQHAYSDDGRGDGRLTYQGLHLINDMNPESSQKHFELPSILFGADSIEWGSQPLLILQSASRREVELMANTLFDQVEADLSAPMPLDGKTTAYRRMRDMFEQEPDRWVALSGHLFIAWGGWSVEHFQGRQDGALIGLALELFHRTHGRYPESLDELVPQWLPAVPVDRITGESLKFKVMDDRPMVHSVGADKDDDGGRMPHSPRSAAHTDPDFAAQWWPADKEKQWIPDGDWILWPRHDIPRMPDSADK